MRGCKGNRKFTSFLLQLCENLPFFKEWNWLQWCVSSSQEYHSTLLAPGDKKAVFLATVPNPCLKTPSAPARERVGLHCSTFLYSVVHRDSLTVSQGYPWISAPLLTHSPSPPHPHLNILKISFKVLSV